MLLKALIIVQMCSIIHALDGPMVITTWGSDGFAKATKNAHSATVAGGRMYGLVEGLSTCESLQCDTTVGYGGSPDESGETNLDALVIDSVGMKMGSVANLHRIKDAARVAWAVMNYTKHTLLVGESATQFAKTMGFKEEDLSSEQTKKWITDWKQNNCQPNFWKSVSPDSAASCGPYHPIPTIEPVTLSSRSSYHVETTNHDTIGMVVLDKDGTLSAGTSSNGARFKIPGRVGDSPVPGAGAYATTKAGAAATGDGDVMMRFLPSFYAVQLMELGSKPQKAATKAIRKILEFYPSFQGAIVAMNAQGKFGAGCANLKTFNYNVAYPNGTVYPQKQQCF